MGAVHSGAFASLVRTFLLTPLESLGGNPDAPPHRVIRRGSREDRLRTYLLPLRALQGHSRRIRPSEQSSANCGPSPRLGFKGPPSGEHPASFSGHRPEAPPTDTAGGDANGAVGPRSAGPRPNPLGYAVLVTGELVLRQARPGDARAIAGVSVASRRWSYRDLLAAADLDALSVEETAADFAQGLAEFPPGAAVFVAEQAGRVVGYVYVLPSPDADVPAGTSDLGSLYVTEEVAGTGVGRALMEAAVAHARTAGQGLLTIWVRQGNGRARRFYEKHGLRPDGAERSGPHAVLPIEIHEIRYPMSLEPRRPQSRGTRSDRREMPRS
jgi:GNAT superfamily N-acetyltransferase